MGRLERGIAALLTVIAVGAPHAQASGVCLRSLSYRLSPTADATESEWACSWSGSDASIAWSVGQASEAALVGTRPTLVIHTGHVCVAAPCPTEWTEVYEQVD